MIGAAAGDPNRDRKRAGPLGLIAGEGDLPKRIARGVAVRSAAD